MMNSKIVKNQENLPLAFFDLYNHELDEHHGDHHHPAEHEPHLSLVGDRRNHVDVFLLRMKANERFFAFWRKTSCMAGCSVDPAFAVHTVFVDCG
jgi:hypothetical protein